MNNSSLNRNRRSLMKRLSVFMVITALLLTGLLGASNALATPKSKLYNNKFANTLTPSKAKIPNNKPATLQYFVGTPDSSPSIAKAGNGETIETTGTGAISLHPKWAIGGGTFVHRDASGNILESGTWEAVKLLSYQSFGPASPSLGLPPGSEGGRALIRIRLLVDGTPLHEATLWVTCKLGNPPRNSFEGIRLAIQDGVNFNKEVSGGTLFIRK